MAFCMFFPGLLLLIILFGRKLYFWSRYYNESSELHSALVGDGLFAFLTVMHAHSCISAESGIS